MSAFSFIGLSSLAGILALSAGCSNLPAQYSTLKEGPVCFASGPAALNHDGLTELFSISGKCAVDVFDFRSMAGQQSLQIKTSFINNRSFHNPSRGSFSVFETLIGHVGEVQIADGDFFFGHFTAPEGSELVADQSPSSGALMIELIAWDSNKQMFNFYELIGAGSAGRWFYRGDSKDILADIEDLHLAAAGSQNFGSRLRCSGCHVNGGPIMKELELPHNDWWSAARPLPLGGRQPDAKLSRILEGLVDGGVFAASVNAGLDRLVKSKPYKAALASQTIQQQLRPLFCAQEINFASDMEPLDGISESIQIPLDFLSQSFRGTLTGGAPVDASKAAYRSALSRFASKFPETNRIDADHGALVPIKAKSDLALISNLLQSEMVTDEFIADVMAIDSQNPALSEGRCKLLRHVPAVTSPNNQISQGDWLPQFIASLKLDASTAAKELLQNLTVAQRTKEFHADAQQSFIAACRQTALTPQGVEDLVTMMAQRRKAVSSNAISTNPRGQILEPGFRVIFPVMQIGSTAFTLDDQCNKI